MRKGDGRAEEAQQVGIRGQIISITWLIRRLLLFPGGLDDDMQSGGLQVELGFFLAAGDDLHWPEPKARRRRSLTPAPAHRLPPLFLWPTVCKVTQYSSEQFWNLSHVIADGCRFEVPSFDGIYLQSLSPLDSCQNYPTLREQMVTCPWCMYLREG